MTNNNKKIGIIVDGHGDFHSIKKRFSQLKVLKSDGPRGHNALIKDIIFKAKKQIKILSMGYKCHKVILLLDMEEREETYDNLLILLQNEVEKNRFDCNVNIVIANKMIENWYLADIEFLSNNCSFLKDRLRQKSYEGKHGKKEIKKLFKKNTNYNEVEHGPKLFLMIRLEVARKNSISLNHFLETLIS
ncbi:MAG: hypothetical protein XD78_0823 [Desulfotomaculum sp. 46_296]|nr:MAG: hypothetical protein XD78_0823 [Desulfotomaculum sp. 46_296]